MTDQECLQVIEFIVSLNEDPSPEEREMMVSDVYTVVHSHLTYHSCHYVHTAWRGRAQEILNAAKQAGFVK
jgi:hypothetical protein